jgi:hypothetical protein
VAYRSRLWVSLVRTPRSRTWSSTVVGRRSCSGQSEPATIWVIGMVGRRQLMRRERGAEDRNSSTAARVGIRLPEKYEGLGQKPGPFSVELEGLELLTPARRTS